MTHLQKTITGFLGLFMLIGGLNKFREPYITMFAEQIRLSGLPFPTLAKWAGEMGEIFAALILLSLLIFWRGLKNIWAERAFFFANALIIWIMTVAVYVHLHPAVPAEVLPFGYKPPVSTLITMFFAALNIYLQRRSDNIAAPS